MGKVKVITGRVIPKKTPKIEKELLSISGIPPESVKFLHTHKKNFTSDQLRQELQRGGPFQKFIILGCSCGVKEKILKIVGKGVDIKICDKIYEMI